MSADHVADQGDEIVKRHRLGPRRVEDRVSLEVGRLDTDAREVTDVHRLHGIAAIAGEREHRHSAQDPRDVVGKDVVRAAEDPRGPDVE